MQTPPSPSNPYAPVVALSHAELCKTQPELFNKEGQPNENTEKVLAAYNQANKFTEAQSLKLSELYQCFSGNLQSLTLDRVAFIKANLPRLLEFAMNKVASKESLSLASSSQLIEIIKGAVSKCMIVCENKESEDAPEILDLTLDEAVRVTVERRSKYEDKHFAPDETPLALLLAQKAMETERIDLLEILITEFGAIDRQDAFEFGKGKLLSQYGSFLLRRKEYSLYFTFRQPRMVDPQYFASVGGHYGSRFNEFKEVIMDGSMDVHSWGNLVRAAPGEKAVMNSILRCSMAARSCGDKGKTLIDSMVAYLKESKDPSRIILMRIIGDETDNYDLVVEADGLLASSEGNALIQKDEQERKLQVFFNRFPQRYYLRQAVAEDDYAKLSARAERADENNAVGIVLKYLKEKYKDPFDVARIFQVMYPLDQLSDGMRIGLIRFLIEEKCYGDAQVQIEQLNLGTYTDEESFDRLRGSYAASMRQHRTKAKLLIELGEATADIECFKKAYGLLRVRETRDIHNAKRTTSDELKRDHLAQLRYRRFDPRYDSEDKRNIIPAVIGNIARLGGVDEAIRYAKDDDREIMGDRRECLLYIAAGTGTTEAIAGEINGRDPYMLNDLAILCNDPNLKREAQKHIFASTSENTALRVAIQYGLTSQDYATNLVDVAAAAENVRNAKTVQRPNRVHEVKSERGATPQESPKDDSNAPAEDGKKPGFLSTLFSRRK